MNTSGVLRTFDIDGDEERTLLEEQAVDFFNESTIHLHGGYSDDYIVVTADGTPYSPIIAAVALAYSIPPAPKAIEFSVRVLPQHQRKGLARRLVQAVVEYATESPFGASQVLAEVVNRDALIPLLQSLGFRADGEGFSGEYWVLDLAPRRRNGAPVVLVRHIQQDQQDVLIYRTDDGFAEVYVGDASTFRDFAPPGNVLYQFEGRVAWLDSMRSSEAGSRKGYGARLLSYVLYDLEARGVEAVGLLVYPYAHRPLDVQSLKAWYERRGFDDISERVPDSSYPVMIRFSGEQPRPNFNLSDYFPDTAAGRLQPRRGEDIFEAGGIGYIGNTDGTMVPVAADNLEAMPENIWDAEKLAALVEAASGREQVLVYPGYADLWVEDGEVHAQVRDGNHRTFAAIEAGSDFAWVMMSDSTRQSLDLRETPDHDQLYRAIRKAQSDYGAPLFKRRRNTIRKGSKYDALLAAEREHAALTRALDEALQAMLLRFGAVEDTGYPLKEQLQRPDIFWRLRIGELAKQHGRDFILDTVYDSPEGVKKRELEKRRGALFDILFDLRKAAGLKHAERLDPVTGLVTSW